jgi:hypothetical protein
VTENYRDKMSTELAEEPRKILIGMTMKEANEYLVDHYVRTWGGRATYVEDSHNKDIREGRIQVDLDEDGKISRIHG